MDKPMKNLGQTAQKAYEDLIKALSRKSPATGTDQIVKKQRCVNVLGKDIACVQDTGSVSIPPVFLVLGVVLLLSMRK